MKRTKNAGTSGSVGGKKSASPKKPIEQYEHRDKKRANIPPVGLVTPDTDPPVTARKTYAYDPHLDPQLVWAGKAERTSFEIPTVSLHVHERIDPRTIIEAVRANGVNNGVNSGEWIVDRKTGKRVRSSLSTGHYPLPTQLPLFARAEENPPLRDAIKFYDHKKPLGWKNRLIAGDSLLVMNSLLEKEGLGGQVQMVYIDPPYGIRYGSNFQPFTNKRDVKDGSDDDLTLEPETLKAFRDTWELGIHSYLTYLRDRLLLANELLHESGSCFVQISDENIHHVREVMDEVFGATNFCGVITFKKTTSASSEILGSVSDYLVWYARDRAHLKYHQLYLEKELGGAGSGQYTWALDAKGQIRRASKEELANPPESIRFLRADQLTSQRPAQEGDVRSFRYEGKDYTPGKGTFKSDERGLTALARAKRLLPVGNTLTYVRYIDDFPAFPISNLWDDTTTSGFAEKKQYVVQTNPLVIQRCLLMTTDPGDLVLDPTCGSGTTAYVAEQWGRRWITTDTSRVAITLAKQRLMTATFDYYTLAHPEQGVGSGFKYKTVPHVTLKSIANNPEIKEGMTREQIDRAIAKYADTETLYDQPEVDNKKARVSGAFTVEAVPSPAVRAIVNSDEWLVDSGEEREYHSSLSTIHSPLTTAQHRQSEWRAELLKTGIRGKQKANIEFVRMEALPGTRWLSADGETKEDKPRRAVVCFGPEHAPLEQRQVAQAIEEAQNLVPKPKLVIFAALQFDPEASKDIDETNWPGVTLLKVQMNGDLVTEDLKKKRSSNESFWLVGQPDVEVVSEQWLVDSGGKRVAPYELGAVVSGLGSLAEINRAQPDDLRVLALAAARRALWAGVADAAGGGVDSVQHRRGSGAPDDGRVQTIPGDRTGEPDGIGDAAGLIEGAGLRDERKRRAFIERLRRNQQNAAGYSAFTIHYPLTTIHYVQVHVHGFDYYNPKSGKVESGGKGNIAMWMLDTDYDGRSVYPRQVFFPMSGEKDGWSRLAKNLKAEIDGELIEQYRGTVSLPFAKGKHSRVAVKIVDDRGIESLRIVDIAG